jgi:Ca2+-binding EF-hand superfamily protein
MRLSALAALATATAFAGAAVAQESIQLRSYRTPEQRAAAFDAADADKNGKLNLAEFRKALPPEALPQITDAMLPEIMSIRDSDGDGFLTKTEFLSVPPPAAQ